MTDASQGAGSAWYQPFSDAYYAAEGFAKDAKNYLFDCYSGEDRGLSGCAGKMFGDAQNAVKQWKDDAFTALEKPEGKVLATVGTTALSATLLTNSYASYKKSEYAAALTQLALGALAGVGAYYAGMSTYNDLTS